MPGRNRSGWGGGCWYDRLPLDYRSALTCSLLVVCHTNRWGVLLYFVTPGLRRILGPNGIIFISQTEWDSCFFSTFVSCDRCEYLSTHLSTVNNEKQRTTYTTGLRAADDAVFIRPSTLACEAVRTVVIQMQAATTQALGHCGRCWVAVKQTRSTKKSCLVQYNKKRLRRCPKTDWGAKSLAKQLPI